MALPFSGLACFLVSTQPLPYPKEAYTKQPQRFVYCHRYYFQKKLLILDILISLNLRSSCLIMFFIRRVFKCLAPLVLLAPGRRSCSKRKSLARVTLGTIRLIQAT